jgi:hypothetical protein
MFWAISIHLAHNLFDTILSGMWRCQETKVYLFTSLFIIYVFICGVFIGAVSSSHHMASSDWLITE